MPLQNFKASNFRGDCFVHDSMVPRLIKMNLVLVKHNMLWLTTSAYRPDSKSIKGAVVKPANRSCHFSGTGIDGNLLENKKNGILYNSAKLGDGTGPDQDCMLEIVKETGLFWGQAFNTPDSVHLDDRINITDPKKWQEIYNELHNIHS